MNNFCVKEMSITREKQIEQLKQEKKKLETKRKEKWNKKYELAKKYYEHHGNLEVPFNFKTTNGYEYDENGIKLGFWIYTQRSAYNGQGAHRITEEQINLLEKIGMRFKIRNNEEEWNKKYELSKKYYEHHGNLEVPREFKTTNGYEYDENGIKLGRWIYIQKSAYNGQGKYKITEDQIKLLSQIGMRFDITNNEEEWNKKYELAKKYYEHHGNLEVPSNFKTTNGYEYDENGIKLGRWICNQRNAYNGQGTCKITEEQINLLEEIEMRFETNKLEEEWNKNYELSKKYYEHHGNLEVPRNFKTTNGYEYDENGIKLGFWICTQRSAYNGQGTHRITEDQINLLEKIGMRFETRNNEEEWNKKYELAKKYYEHHGDLEIPQRFKTTNGYEYDENGIKLGGWICTQRSAYNGQGKYKITEDQIKLLSQIGMRFDITNNEEEWNKKYELAKKYYEHHGNLEVPSNFKTTNGYEYDENGIKLGSWIRTQRSAYNGQGKRKITGDQINLLEKIGMTWLFSKNDVKLQLEKFTKANITRKNIEILNRTRTILNRYADSELPSKEEINEEFIKKLDMSLMKK